MMAGSRSQFREYLVAAGLGFAVAAIVAIGCISFFAITVAPRLSSSLSFNQKARWLKGTGSCEMVVAGSSMALNDIDGVFLRDSMGAGSLVNTGSWGVSVADAARLVRVLERRCKPDIVVVPVYYGDFSSSDGLPRSGALAVDWKMFADYVSGGVWRLRSPEAFNLQYMYDSYRKLGSPGYRLNTYYTSLEFDETGGVLLASDGFHKDPARWTGYRRFVSEPVVRSELDALRGLVADLVAKDVQVVVVKVPLTSQARRAFSTAEFDMFWARVASDVNSRGGIFVDAGVIGLDDSQFVDFCHLDADGARSVSRLVADELARSGRERSKPTPTR